MVGARTDALTCNSSLPVEPSQDAIYDKLARMKLLMSPEQKAYLNLGCGGVWFSEWNNCDFFPRRHIISVDLKKPLPWPDNSFDAVYNSHVLEHFTLEGSKQLLHEMHRVLKPGGVCRVVVPDLEMICRLYLDYLQKAKNTPNSKNNKRYQWILVELLDQMVREKSGGLMKQMLDGEDFDDELMETRLGDNFNRHQFQSTQPDLNRSDIAPELSQQKDPWNIRLHRRRLKIKLALFGGGSDPRATGEAHKWMYDRFSLPTIMNESGFHNCYACAFDESRMPHWKKYNLDISKHGERPRKPDSLYVEGIK